VLAGLSLAFSAAADTWPSKPIKYVVPFSPGGVSDATARIVAEGLSQRLGQPVVIENKPGVSGILGTQAVARRTRRLHDHGRHHHHARGQSVLLQEAGL
jgi:tripartite-type tricarboxylate transporter receptor subunit TctC